MIYVWARRFNTLMPRYKRRHITDDIFKYILLKEKFCILIRIPLHFVSTDQIDNKRVSVQVMACRLFGAEPMQTQLTDAYMWH